MKLKIKPSVWLVGFTRPHKHKREYRKMTGYSCSDILNQIYENPNYNGFEVKEIIELSDEIILPKIK